jgi:hypothetical protein
MHGKCWNFAQLSVELSRIAEESSIEAAEAAISAAKIAED